jgi:endonuclease/exonuclease/phosphatase family metal-dependent hydrolase
VHSSRPSSSRRLAAFVRRHRWGFLTLSAALFVWGVGALATPAPSVLGGVLLGVCALLLLALARFGVRARDAFAVEQRRRTHTSMALYATSLLLSVLFLGGLFIAPQSAIVMDHPTLVTVAPRPMGVASWLPAIALPALVTVERLTSKLPALYQLGSPGPLASAVEDVVRPALADRDDTLRILDWNVWHGYPGSSAREERYQHIRELIEEFDPDVVLLQEAWSTRRFGSLADRLSHDLGLGFAYARANGSLRYLGFEEGLAIFSRYPLSEVRRLGLGPRMPPWEMRAALGGVITLPSGETLEIWNTHLSHSDAFAREGQARSLASALEGSRVALLGGDFNGAVSTPAVTAFAALELAPVLSDGIDHLLASSALRAQWATTRAEARRFGDVPVPGTLLTRPEVSDHPALLVELRRRPVTGAELVDTAPAWSERAGS